MIAHDCVGQCSFFSQMLVWIGTPLEGYEASIGIYDRVVVFDPVDSPGGDRRLHQRRALWACALVGKVQPTHEVDQPPDFAIEAVHDQGCRPFGFRLFGPKTSRLVTAGTRGLPGQLVGAGPRGQGRIPQDLGARAAERCGVLRERLDGSVHRVDGRRLASRLPLGLRDLVAGGPGLVGDSRDRSCHGRRGRRGDGPGATVAPALRTRLRRIQRSRGVAASRCGGVCQAPASAHLGSAIAATK
jgi:hypothetical protein